MALKMDEEELPWFNETNDTKTSFSGQVSLNLIVSLSVMYVVIFVTGTLGNIMTCIVIGRNRSLHTDTNMYLVNLAIADLLLLISGMTLEIIRLWKQFSYSLLESLRIIMLLTMETSANGTILTITTLAVERYISICCSSLHKPFNLSMTVRYIIVIWTCSLCSAVPQAMQFGIISSVSSFTFFIVPVPVITVLYVLIGVKLHTSRVLHPVENSTVESGDRVDGTPRYRRGDSQRKVLRMLVAVTLSFFLCCAPFYVEILLAIYGKNLEHPTHSFYKVYEILKSLSCVLYFFSASIKPFLYIIMSDKFRDAFKATLSLWCTRRERYRLNRTYSVVLAERRQRAVAIASQRPHNPRMLQRFSTTSFPQCDATPREQNHSGLLEQQREDAAARESQCPHNPRMLRHFAAATCQQCVAPPRNEAKSRFNKHQSALLELQRKEAAARARASQRPQNPRMLQRIATTSSQQRVAPPRAQAKSRFNKHQSALLELQRKEAAARARASQRQQNPRMLQHIATTSQECVAPPRAQAKPGLKKNHNALLKQQRKDAVSQHPQNPQMHQHIATASFQQCVKPPRAQPFFNGSNLSIVIEESESWLERQRLAVGSDSITSPESISNSSLREVNQELSAEELATFLYQVNCKIKGETTDTSV